MSFQLSMKFRWAARIFFCWASKSNFSPQKISTDSERVRCVISLFRSEKKNKSSLHQRIFRVNPFRYTKNFLGRRSWRREKHFFFGWVGHWKSLAPPLCVILLYFFLPPFSSATHVRSSGGSVASTDAWDNGFPSLRTWRAHKKKFGRKRRRFPARYFTFFFFFYFTLSLSRLKWRPPPAVVAAGGLFHLFRPFHPKKKTIFFLEILIISTEISKSDGKIGASRNFFCRPIFTLSNPIHWPTSQILTSINAARHISVFFFSSKSPRWDLVDSAD